jgi:hypothetical protein
MRAAWRIGVIVAAAALGALPVAHALTRKEVACQAAIARASRAFVAAELASRGRCQTLALQARPCDPTDRTEANRATLRKALARCTQVALGRLPGGGCAAASDGVSALAAHEQAIDTLLTAEFGVDAAESAATDAVCQR